MLGETVGNLDALVCLGGSVFGGGISDVSLPALVAAGGALFDMTRGILVTPSVFASEVSGTG